MNKTLHIIHFTTKWLLYIGILSFTLLLEKFFIGFTSLLGKIAEIMDLFLLFLGMILMSFSFFYFPVVIIILIVFRIYLISNKSEIINPYSIKKNLKLMTICGLTGFVIFMFSLYFLESRNTLRVKNIADQKITDINIDGYGYSKTFSIEELNPGESQTFKISHSNWQRNEDDYEISYMIEGKKKIKNKTGNMGISVFKIQ